MEVGQVLIIEGMLSGGFYVIFFGEVVIYRNDAIGCLVYFVKLIDGEFFGEVLLLSGGVVIVSVKVFKPGMLLKFLVEKFREVISLYL